MSCKCEEEVTRVDSVSDIGRNMQPLPNVYTVDAVEDGERVEAPSGYVDNPTSAAVFIVTVSENSTSDAEEGTTEYILDKTAGEILAAFKKGLVLLYSPDEQAYVVINAICWGDEGYSVTIVAGETPAVYTADTADDYPTMLVEA